MSKWRDLYSKLWLLAENLNYIILSNKAKAQIKEKLVLNITTTTPCIPVKKCWASQWQFKENP